MNNTHCRLEHLIIISSFVLFNSIVSSRKSRVMHFLTYCEVNTRLSWSYISAYIRNSMIPSTLWWPSVRTHRWSGLMTSMTKKWEIWRRNSTDKTGRRWKSWQRGTKIKVSWTGWRERRDRSTLRLLYRRGKK